MHILVNGHPLEIDAGCSVAELLTRHRNVSGPCAVEVNKALVPKREHGERELVEGDAIEIVTLVGGG